jgi:hypothetical protein
MQTIKHHQSHMIRTNMEINEALCCFPVQQIHEEQRQGRPVPRLLLNSEENCKMVEKGGTVSHKL